MIEFLFKLELSDCMNEVIMLIEWLCKVVLYYDIVNVVGNLLSVVKKI